MDTPVANQIAKLAKMGLPELRDAYEKAFGKPTKSRNRKQLFSQIARKLQDGDGTSVAISDGKPTLTAKFKSKQMSRSRNMSKSAKKKSQPVPIGARDSRLPKVGTTIERIYKGKKHLVRVLDQGFEYDGKEYRSLSALAKHITGQIINGFVWFKLGAKAKETK